MGVGLQNILEWERLRKVGEGGVEERESNDGMDCGAKTVADEEVMHWEREITPTCVLTNHKQSHTLCKYVGENKKQLPPPTTPLHTQQIRGWSLLRITQFHHPPHTPPIINKLQVRGRDVVAAKQTRTRETKHVINYLAMKEVCLHLLPYTGKRFN